MIAADRDPLAPGFAYADRRAIVPVDDEPALERLAEAERVDGVIAPGPEAPVGAAARVAARLGLAHPLSPETAVLSSSKLRQRERLASANVPQTGWQVVSEPDEVVRVPCLVRPPDRPGRGARSLVRSSRELRAALKSALRASRLGLCLVEEVVEQPVVTVTAFSREGRLSPSGSDRPRRGERALGERPSRPRRRARRDRRGGSRHPRRLERHPRPARSGRREGARPECVRRSRRGRALPRRARDRPLLPRACRCPRRAGLGAPPPPAAARPARPAFAFCPTAKRCSRRPRRARRLTAGRIVQPSAYASRRPMPRLSE